ncbi:MAG: hypothetical protein ACE5HY_02445, partial [Candidatus Hydrothermarchaeales archaeon]
GEWINWWLIHSKLSKEERRVINPGVAARYRGERRHADILFLEKYKAREKNKREYRVLGVAEVENNNTEAQLKNKLKSLKFYVKDKRKNRGYRFPHLKFVLLSTHFEEEKLNKLKEVIKKLKELSETTSRPKITWILYVAKKEEIDEDDEIAIDGYAIDKSLKRFYYSFSYLGEPDFILIRNGRIKKSTPTLKKIARS